MASYVCSGEKQLSEEEMQIKMQELYIAKCRKIISQSKKKHRLIEELVKRETRERNTNLFVDPYFEDMRGPHTTISSVIIAPYFLRPRSPRL
jgi:hypothetical protein